MKDPSEVYRRLAGRLTLALDLIEGHVRFMFVDQAAFDQQHLVRRIQKFPCNCNSGRPGTDDGDIGFKFATRVEIVQIIDLHDVPIRSASRFRMSEIQSHSVDGDQ